MQAFVCFGNDGGKILRGGGSDFVVGQNTLDNRHFQNFAEIRFVGSRRGRIVFRETDGADGRNQIAVARFAACGETFAVQIQGDKTVVIGRNDGKMAAAERFPIGAVRGVYADFHAVIPEAQDGPIR